MAKVPITIEVNGESHEALIKTSTILLDFLRDHLFLTGRRKDVIPENAGPAQ